MAAPAISSTSPARSFDTNGELVAGGIVPQTKQTSAHLRMILGQAGRTLDNGIKCNVWRADARGFSGCKSSIPAFFPTPRRRARPDNRR